MPIPPTLPGSIRCDFPRLDLALVEAFTAIPAAAVCDSNHRLGALPAAFRCLTNSRRMVGSAFTVEDVEGGNMMATVALGMIQPGDVLVIDAKGATSRAVLGGVMAGAALKKGAAGIVVNGVVRDRADLEQTGLPVFALGFCPAGPIKGWGGSINQPVGFSGVVINPGDLIVGDGDGVVVISAAKVSEVLQIARELLKREAEWKAKIEAGVSLIEATKAGAYFEKLDIRYE